MAFMVISMVALRSKYKTLALTLDERALRLCAAEDAKMLGWTCKSTPKLASELQGQGDAVSQATVWRLLDELDYGMQSNRKTREGTGHADRNAQFEFINGTAKDFLARGLPVISVDTKKKELVGPFKNGGREWEKKSKPKEVNTRDFPDKKLGKVSPYGVYDVGRNEGRHEPRTLDSGRD